MNKLSMRAIRAHKTPRNAITLWWLGQAGFILKSPGGTVAVLDPYLSNSCKALGEQAGFDLNRQIPPPIDPGELAGVHAYLMTHSHLDHLDPDTLGPYRKAGGRGPFFAPPETCEKLRALGVPPAETTMVWPNKEVQLEDVVLRATFAIPFSGDDLTHVGYLVSVKDGPKVYFTGDTAYNELLAMAVEPHKPDVLVTVINGAFRNLCPAEAALLAKQLGVKVVIPCHHDLFLDNCQPPQMLHTNLKLQGIGDRYRQLQHGEPFDFALNR
jgi:L-ascorbate 6-phosphate lactonase